MTSNTHRSTAEFVVDEDGWTHPICSCGYSPGAFPTPEDAADAMMDHAYVMGVSDAAHNALETR